MVIQPCNDVDIFSQDVGFIPHVVKAGWKATPSRSARLWHEPRPARHTPFLAQPLLYVKRPHVVDACEAIVTTQRDHGNRTDRKRPPQNTPSSPWARRLPRRGRARLPASRPSRPRSLKFDTVEDNLGWHEQGDGKLYCAVYVSMGRIVNCENGPQYRSAFAEIATQLDLPFIVTPNTNLIIADVAPEQKEQVNAILAKHGVVHADEAGFTRARKVAHACVALPTCGLALSESERALPGFMDQFDAMLQELGIADEPVLFRMTGCPNGCGRPYNADFGFVGRAPNKWAMFVGGSIRGDTLRRPRIQVRHRRGDPRQSPRHPRSLRGRAPAGRDLRRLVRPHPPTKGAEPTPEQFHIELAERAAKLAGEKAGEAG